MPVTIPHPSFGGIGAVDLIRDLPRPIGSHRGLKVVVPSTPVGCLLAAAICDRRTGPGIFLEPKRRYWTGARHLGARGADWAAAIRRSGDDVTVVTYGSLVATA